MPLIALLMHVNILSLAWLLIYPYNRKYGGLGVTHAVFCNMWQVVIPYISKSPQFLVNLHCLIFFLSKDTQTHRFHSAPNIKSFVAKIVIFSTMLFRALKAAWYCILVLLYVGLIKTYHKRQYPN